MVWIVGSALLHSGLYGQLPITIWNIHLFYGSFIDGHYRMQRLFPFGQVSLVLHHRLHKCNSSILLIHFGRLSEIEELCR